MTVNALVLNPSKTCAKQIPVWAFPSFTDCPQNEAHSMNLITLKARFFQGPYIQENQPAITSTYKAQMPAPAAGPGFVPRVEMLVSA